MFDLLGKFIFCIMYFWMYLDVYEVTYWFVNLICYCKAPNYPLIEYAAINNRFMSSLNIEPMVTWDSQVTD